MSRVSGTPLGGSRQQPFMIESPLVMMFQGADKNVTCHIHPGDLTHKHYGVLICDLFGTSPRRSSLAKTRCGNGSTRNDTDPHPNLRVALVPDTHDQLF